MNPLEEHSKIVTWTYGGEVVDSQARWFAVIWSCIFISVRAEMKGEHCFPTYTLPWDPHSPATCFLSVVTQPGQCGLWSVTLMMVDWVACRGRDAFFISFFLLTLFPDHIPLFQKEAIRTVLFPLRLQWWRLSYCCTAVTFFRVAAVKWWPSVWEMYFSCMKRSQSEFAFQWLPSREHPFSRCY